MTCRDCWRGCSRSWPEVRTAPRARTASRRWLAATAEVAPANTHPAATAADEVAMAQGRSRPAWAEIDLAAVAHNAAVLARVAAPAELCAVVKAHGYGHGGPAVACAALAGGASRLAVALVDEGVELRQHGVDAPVLSLSECHVDAIESVLGYGLTPTVYTREAVAEVASASRAAGRRTPVHVKVDTGMHRVGAAPEELRALVAAVAGAGALARGGLDASGGGRRRARRGPRLHRHPTGPLRRRGGRSHRVGGSGSRAPRGQHRGRGRIRAGRATAWCAAASASMATCRAPRCSAPSTCRRPAKHWSPPCR